MLSVARRLSASAKEAASPAALVVPACVAGLLRVHYSRYQGENRENA
jgi:hypothetical protein